MLILGRNVELDLSENRCWKFDACNNLWEPNPGVLNEKRQNAVGQVLPYLLLGTEKPWILGGQGDFNNVSSSTEFYNGINWVISDSNSLDEEKFGACSATAHSSSVRANDVDELILLIGGKKTFREVESFFGNDDESNNIEKTFWTNVKPGNV